MEPKVAIGLFGISYLPVYRTSWGMLTHIDYGRSLDNYRQYLFDYFRQRGYAVDTYLSTYDHSHAQQMLNDLQPKAYLLTSCPSEHNYHSTRDNGRRFHFQQLLNLIPGQQYEWIILTRFDLMFAMSLDKVEIKPGVLNLVSEMHHPGATCDNFYLVPGSLWEKFVQFFRRHQHDSPHWIYNDYLTEVGPVHFLHNQKCPIHKMDFYKICRHAPDEQAVKDFLQKEN